MSKFASRFRLFVAALCPSVAAFCGVLAVLATAALAGAPLSGQTMLGVRGGASVAQVSATGGAKGRTGFGVGVFVEVPISSPVAVQGEVAFVQKGNTAGEGIDEIDYFEFSALLKAKSSGTPSVYAFAGPTVAVSPTGPFDAVISDIFGDEPIDSSDFGIKGGAGAATMVGESVRLSLELAYALGLKDIGGGRKNRALLVQAAIAFPIG